MTKNHELCTKKALKSSDAGVFSDVCPLTQIQSSQVDSMVMIVYV